jgi:hypothetical protein
MTYRYEKRPPEARQIIPPAPGNQEGYIGPYQDRRTKINMNHIFRKTGSATAILLLRENSKRKAVTIKNNSSGGIIVELTDGPNVPYGGGYPLNAGSTLSSISILAGEISQTNFNPQGELWAICSGSADIAVWEFISQEKIQHEGVIPTYPPYPFEPPQAYNKPDVLTGGVNR